MSERFVSVRRPIAQHAGIALSCTALLAGAAIVMTAGAGADANLPTPPLPVFTPTPTDWAPNFAFPNNLSQSAVTDADINAERDMCEWFNAQFDTLMHQINDLNGNLAGSGDNYTADNIQQADAVTANIDQSENYLAPRAQAFNWLTEWYDDGAGGNTRRYIPIFEGNGFYALWQQLSNVGTSIKNHNPSGINNISIGMTNLYANGIRGSGVCA